MNPKGERLLAWAEGTGWQKGGSLVWQLFEATGRPLGEPNRVENGVAVWSFAAALARADGSFVVLHWRAETWCEGHRTFVVRGEATHSTAPPSLADSDVEMPCRRPWCRRALPRSPKAHTFTAAAQAAGASPTWKRTNLRRVISSPICLDTEATWASTLRSGFFTKPCSRRQEFS